jgi:hypothetical protein
VSSTPISASAADRDEARQLLAAAKYLKDVEDEQGFAEVWAAEASLSIRSTSGEFDPIVGRDAIMDFYRGSWARGGHGTGAERETHVFGNPYIVPHDDGQLLAIHSAVFVGFESDNPIVIGFGDFRDTLVKENGRWRILKRESSLRRRPRPKTRESLESEDRTFGD